MLHPRRIRISRPGRLTALLAAILGLLALLATGGPSPVVADHLDFQKGDLFVSVGGGIIRRFDTSGNQVEDLDTQTGSAEIGDLCFSENGMFSMNFQDGSISRFDGKGALVESHWATGLDSEPESCVFDNAGNLFVGEQSSSGGALQVLSSSGSISQTFKPDPENSGVDEIDLEADQCTMLYTSEGGTIKAFNVCTSEQLPDFASGLGQNCNNLRIRPNKEVLVACDVNVLRLNQDGAVIKTYAPPNIDPSSGGLFALNLDSDGQHFFTATYKAGLVWRVDIESGQGVGKPYLQTVLAGDSIGGLAIFGEISVAVTAPAAAASRPEIVRSVPDPRDISTKPDVVGTNVAFAIVAAIVVLLTSQVFNATIKENNAEIEGFVKRYIRPFAAPFRAIGDAAGNAASSSSAIGRFAPVGVVLVATAVVYGFLEPGFKLDSDSILLVVAMVIALGVTTYVHSGVESRVYERRFSTPAGVRVYPVALAIAAASVLLSRLISFQPGIIYGFVASSALLADAELHPRQQGQACLVAALALLGAFAVAWAAMIPFREWADHDANALSVVLESSSTMIVVGALESLTFSMVPLQFTDGDKVFRFNRVLWFVLAVALAFLFWHVLLVQDKAGFKAVGAQETVAAIIALAVCVGLTGAVWGFFYYRHRRAAAAREAPPTEAAVATPEAIPTDVAPVEPEESPTPEIDAAATDAPDASPPEPDVSH